MRCLVQAVFFVCIPMINVCIPFIIVTTFQQEYPEQSGRNEWRDIERVSGVIHYLLLFIFPVLSGQPVESA